MIDAREIGNLCRRLEASYRWIERERMADIPILNPALKVQAVSFREWDASFIGVMLTPWFMNLMLLPKHVRDWSELAVLSKVSHAFPSGRYEFIVGEEADIGKYQMCSLFSPVFEFHDHDTALATARAVITELMDDRNRCDVSTHQKEITRRWCDDTMDVRDDDDGVIATVVPTEQKRASLSERAHGVVSRRELFRGALMRDRGAEP